MRGWRDWVGAFVVVALLCLCGSVADSEAGPLRGIARGIGKGGAKVGRFVFRRVTLQRVRGCSSSGSSASGGSCANGACSP